jgi:hypothetical protein
VPLTESLRGVQRDNFRVSTNTRVLRTSELEAKLTHIELLVYGTLCTIYLAPGSRFLLTAQEEDAHETSVDDTACSLINTNRDGRAIWCPGARISNSV